MAPPVLNIRTTNVDHQDTGADVSEGDLQTLIEKAKARTAEWIRKDPVLSITNVNITTELVMQYEIPPLASLSSDNEDLVNQVAGVLLGLIVEAIPQGKPLSPADVAKITGVPVAPPPAPAPAPKPPPAAPPAAPPAPSDATPPPAPAPTPAPAPASAPAPSGSGASAPPAPAPSAPPAPPAPSGADASAPASPVAPPAPPAPTDQAPPPSTDTPAPPPPAPA